MSPLPFSLAPNFFCSVSAVFNLFSARRRTRADRAASHFIFCCPYRCLCACLSSSALACFCPSSCLGWRFCSCAFWLSSCSPFPLKSRPPGASLWVGPAAATLGCSDCPGHFSPQSTINSSHGRRSQATLSSSPPPAPLHFGLHAGRQPAGLALVAYAPAAAGVDAPWSSRDCQPGSQWRKSPRTSASSAIFRASNLRLRFRC